MAKKDKANLPSTLTGEPKRRAYPKGRGALILNSSLHSEAVERMKLLFIESFANVGIKLEAVYADPIPHYMGKTFPKEMYRFYLFYDKDIFLAYSIATLGKPIFNKPEAIMNCDSKLFTHAMLVDAKVPTIPTIGSPLHFNGKYGKDPDFLLEAEREFGYPMVIKEEYGSLGEQVYLVHNNAEANQLIAEKGDKRLLAQPYLSYSKGKDLRLYVVGGKVVGAIERYNPNDFRSNIENGGSAKPLNPPASAKRLAIKAAKALKLDFAGVDIIEEKEGKYLICEVNSNPHFIGLLETTGIDLSVPIAKYVAKKIGSL